MQENPLFFCTYRISLYYFKALHKFFLHLILLSPPHISPSPLHYIRNREIVLLLLCIPYDADFLALKELYGEIIERTKRRK